MISSVVKNRVAENIPFSCFYNNSTLLTKSSSLVKVIKISCARGFNISSDFDITAMLQSRIKELLYNHDVDIAFWINTFRRKRDIKLQDESVTDDFSLSLSKKYNNEIENQDQFYTEFYISIVSESILKEIAKLSNFLLLQLIKSTQSYGDKLLSAIEKVVEDILFSLKIFSPKLLEDKECLDFISLIFDCEKNIGIPNIIDISEATVENKNIFFSFNTFQLNSNKKKFGTVLKLKDYKNTKNIKLINNLINCNFELIITEIITQVPFSEIKKEFKDRDYFFEIANDEDFLKVTRFDEINNKILKKDYTEFCTRNLTITVFTDDIEELNSVIGRIKNILLENGITIIRYDLLLQDAFWSNFPGNFSYLPPKSVNLISDCATFALTHVHFQSEKSKSIAKFLSTDNNIHYFNFNTTKGNLGNVIIIGQKAAGKTVLQNFLISEAYIKNKIRLLIIDEDHLSKIFINSLNGMYYDINLSASDNGFMVNIFDINDKYVLERILKKICNTQEQKDKVPQLVDEIMSVPVKDRSLANFQGKLSELLGNIGAIETKFKNFFSVSNNNVLQNDVLGFGFEDMMNINRIASLIVFYIIHKYVELSQLDGKPFIISLQNDWRFKNLFESSMEFENFLLKVKNAGGLVIFSTTGKNNILTGDYKNISDLYIKTRILIPSDKANFQYIKSFNIENNDVKMLQKAMLYDKCFFLKQGNEQIILKFDLSNFNEKYILSATSNTIGYMQTSIKQAGNNPNLWIPIFYKQCSQE
jgi:type IV secretion system protein VirB4